MNFIEELSWRGMLHDQTPGLAEHLASGVITGYIGFDPTAASMTIGNYVQIMLLSLFQRSGHRPIALMGGATGRIGDPSGKDKERVLKTEEELDANLALQSKQLEKFLEFGSGKYDAVIVNNYEFYKDMGVLEFLRKIGKHLTVSYMMAKDSVKNRMESGLSFTEFSYQLLQAYDFVSLRERYDCSLQMGGSDQWGNITSGTELVRRMLDKKVYAVTTPLLTKSDGKKFGKSEQGNLWLSAEMTSPYQFYQFWINADDADIGKFTRYFTFKSKEEVEAQEKVYADDPAMLKKLLAEELTTRIHGKEDYEAVLAVSELLFNKKLSKDYVWALTEKQLSAVAKEIPSFQLDIGLLESPKNCIDLLVEDAKIIASKSMARQAIRSNALSINKEKLKDFSHMVSREDLLQGRYLLIENGKKNKFIITFNL